MTLEEDFFPQTVSVAYDFWLWGRTMSTRIINWVATVRLVVLLIAQKEKADVLGL